MFDNVDKCVLVKQLEDKLPCKLCIGVFLNENMRFLFMPVLDRLVLDSLS